MVSLSIVQQSAVLPFMFRKGRLELLLITSIRTKRWILPKGHIEPGLNARQSAEFEALEEAGVVGEMKSQSIGAYNYRKHPERGGYRCRVRVFAMKVTRVLDDYPEKELRERKWMSVRKALKFVQEPELRSLIKRFEKNQKYPRLLDVPT